MPSGTHSFPGKRTLEILAIVECVGVPLLSAILIFALDVGYDPDAPLFWTHVARDNFTCSPRFRTLAIEFTTVHIHFIICSVVIVWGLVQVARCAFNDTLGAQVNWPSLYHQPLC